MLAESPEISALFDFVHQVALSDTPRVSLATFCLPAPPFLHIWCGKYGIDPDRVCLYQVQVSEPGERACLLLHSAC